MMNNSNSNHTLSIFIFFLSIFSLKLTLSTQIHCPEIEKHSLLNFKHSLNDPNNQLSSWETEPNCCKWEGVVCSNSTGHVHRLRLHGFTGGRLNPSLLNLTRLEFLDLSRNNFLQTIPPFIGSFEGLNHLNLSDAGFHGKIPPAIGNLSRLQSLSVSGSLNMLSSENLEWLSGLPELRHLDMDFVDIGKSRNWLQVISSLPSLKELHFKNCSIESFPPLINGVKNISSLSYLDLSYNNFHSLSIPPWIFHLTDLLHLDLSFSKLNGPIPTFNNATKLVFIDLSQNPLNSTIPEWIYSCRDLQFLHFSYSLMRGGISGAVANLTSLKTLNFFGNQLSGEIPPQISHMCGLEFLFLTYNQFVGDVSDSFGNMSDCFLESIKLLSLRSNNLHGRIPEGFGGFKRIQFLHFGGNAFSGEIPATLGRLTSLEELSLYGNEFSGGLPESFGQLSSLEEIYMDDCMLEGIVTENHFSKLKRFKILSAPGNFLTLDVKPDWVPPFQLVALKVASWRFGSGGGIPAWIESQRNVSELDLSDIGISGTVPAWFWEVPFLNLSLNGLHGEVPDLNRARFLYLSSNGFSGSLPRIGGGSLREIDLSNNSFSGGMSRFLCSSSQTNRVEILHLAGNDLNGELPDCWEKWTSLKYLNLGNNSLFGEIPTSIGFLENLQSLNLYRNKFSGRIPSSMSECRELIKMELSENSLDGNLPTWIGTRLVKLRILVLRSNSFNGEIPIEICNLTSLQILDLSRNMFDGRIPNCVNNFIAMSTKRSLDKYGYSSSSSSSYSGASFIDSALVATKGSILQYDTILSLVTNVDLSSNNLSGVIPSELTSLVELRSLNLSRNGLSGSIPRDIGDMKELESLDLSRNFLSSQIPTSLSSVYSLSHLDLSYNNLSGRIPTGTQIQSFDASSFVGNDLCGTPLARSCSSEGRGERGERGEREERDGDGDGVEVNWFYVFLSSGYVVGFGVVCTTLLLNKRWRDAYFGLFFKK